MTTFNSYGPVAPQNALAQIVKLDDNQVRLILNQLARAKIEEDA